MTDILDSILSSFILTAVLALFLLIFFIVLSVKNLFKNNFLNKCYKGIMYVCSGASFFIIPFLNYGHARGFEKIAIGKTTICLFERHIPARGRSSGRSARINIIDKGTGVRIERFNAGSPGIFIAMHNDTICYMDKKEMVIYDAANLKEIYRIKEDGWGNILPELSAGVENIDVTNDHSDYSIKHYISLDCLNGKKYWFEPFSQTISGKEPLTLEYIPSFSGRSSELVVKLSYRKELKYLFTTNTGSGRLETIMPGVDGRKFFSKVDSTGYIAPFLLCIDTVTKFFVFGHYLTTKKENYYLEAKNFNYTTLWKKLSTDIIDTDDQVMDVWIYKDNILYFNISGYIFAIDPLTFKINWTSRL